MSAAALLPLSAIVDTLPVLFGRDGDFEGAPDWRCNLFHDGGYVPFFSFRVDGEFTFFSAGSSSICSRRRSVELLEGYALDLRVPSVASRVAGLCARALGYTDAATWGVTISAQAWSLRGIPVSPRSMWQQAPEFAWERSTGRPMGYAGTDHPPIPALLGATEAASFLSALFLALAPRIAALGGNNVR